MKKAVIYVRVSTEEQADEGKSIETQEKVCRKWAESNDYSIVAVYKDEGKSATSLNRQGLQEMLSACRSDNIIQAILVQDTDRIARNTLDHLTVKAFLKKNDVQLISISQPMIDDSPEGNLIDTIIASVNAFQSQLTGRKTSKVLEEKAELGWYPGGKPPIGYKNVDNPNPLSTLDKKIVVLDEPVARYMQKFFKMYATGSYSIKQVTDFLNKNGVKSVQGKKINISTAHNYLRSRFYIGFFLWKGKEYKGNHQLFIDKPLFNKIQLVLESHNHHASRQRVHNYLLRGFLYCSNCKSRYWAEHHKKPNGLLFDFYFCSSCKGSTYTDTSLLEKQVEKIFGTIQLSKEYTQHVMDTAQRMYVEMKSDQEVDLKQYYSKRSKIESAIKQVEEDRFVHKTLTPEQFQKVNDRFTADLENLEEEVTQLKKDFSQSLKTLEKILLLAENIGESYKDAKDPLKRKYLALFFKKFYVDAGNIVKYELTDDLKELIQNGSVRVSKNGLRRLKAVRTFYIKQIIMPSLSLDEAMVQMASYYKNNEVALNSQFMS